MPKMPRDPVKKKASDKAWREAHKEVLKAKSAAYRNGPKREELLEKKRKQAKGRVRKPLTEEQKRKYNDTRLRRAYGIGVEDYERLLAEQGGGCAMCGAPPTTKRLHIDHDHKTGLVRGLLCNYCNYRVLGRNNIERMRSAVAYLERHEAKVQAQNENNGRVEPGKTPRRRRKARTNAEHPK